MVAVSSWGRLSQDAHTVCVLTNRTEVHRQMQSETPGLAHGMGRSYGDVCLNPGKMLWQTTSLNRFIHFDEATGRLQCEAGVLLRDIQRLFVPRGWMLPVTPGTQFVTVGGAIANDVHGKNHHRVGTFGHHVCAITLQRTDGTMIICDPINQADWFAATVGGLGLTGIILTVELQLRRVAGPWLETKTIPFFELDEFFHLADAAENTSEYTVAWIDCLSRRGRGLFTQSNSAKNAGVPAEKRQKKMFFTPPVSLVNRLSLSAFNHLYFYLHKQKKKHSIEHYETALYPLDHLLEWNRMYGPRGFYQYQCVVPRLVGHDAICAMLHEIARSKNGSFLAVLKTFGEHPSRGMLSFPQKGVTLALDFPNQGARTLQLFARLDSIVYEAGGRLYPAKDARMSKAMFRAGYPLIDQFKPYRDPGITSALAQRLIDGE